MINLNEEQLKSIKSLAKNAGFRSGKIPVYKTGFSFINGNYSTFKIMMDHTGNVELYGLHIPANLSASGAKKLGKELERTGKLAGKMQKIVDNKQ